MKVQAKVTEFKNVEVRLDVAAEASVHAVMFEYLMTGDSYLGQVGGDPVVCRRDDQGFSKVVVPKPSAEQLEVLDVCMKFLKLAMRVHHTGGDQ